jgi:hypothetical protein
MRPMRVQHLLAAVVAGVAIVLGVATSAAAQAKAVGTVRDLAGKAIKGATVKAVNPDASPSEFASATDDKGRWAMIGLKTGTWRFIVEAPGYAKVEASLPVRVSSSAPVGFTMARDLGPLPNALDRNIQQLIEDAAVLREQGRLDQALIAYQDIRAKNPTLTSVNLVIADLYRRKAAQENDPAARQALFRQALDSYDQMLKSDATNERARAESAEVRAAAGRNE